MDLGYTAVEQALTAIYEYTVNNDGPIHQRAAIKGLRKLCWLYDSPTYKRHLDRHTHPGFKQVLALGHGVEQVSQEMITLTYKSFLNEKEA